jgi:hypothetical protein
VRPGIPTARRPLRFVESFAVVLPETPELFTKWRGLVVTYQVSGAKVHDARLVAAMTLHHISDTTAVSSVMAASRSAKFNKPSRSTGR